MYDGLSSLTAYIMLDSLVPAYVRQFAQDMIAFMERLSAAKQGTMLLTKQRHPNTHLSSRNLRFLNLLTLDNINARDLVKARADVWLRACRCIL